MAERRLPDETVIRQLVERALEARRGRHRTAGVRPDRGGDPASPATRPPPAPAAGADTVAIGADHGGFGLKAVLVKHLARQGLRRHRLRHQRPRTPWTTRTSPTSWRASWRPGACATGIVIDGAGIGSAMAANKVPGRPRGERPRHVHGPQRPRAQLRQRADPRRAHDRRGPGPRDRRHVPRHPVGCGAARRARRQDHRTSSSSTERPRQRNPSDDRPARRPRPAHRGDHPPGHGVARRPRGADGSATGNCATCTGGCAARCAPKVAEVVAGGASRVTYTRRGRPRPGGPRQVHRPHPAQAGRHRRRRRQAVRRGGPARLRVRVHQPGLGLARGREPQGHRRSRSPRSSASRSAPRMPEIKAHEARQVIRAGAREIDMVINIGALKSGLHDQVRADIAAVSDACHEIGRHQQGHHRDRAPHRPREGDRVPAREAGEGGLREDQHRLRLGRRHRVRRRADARGRRAADRRQGRGRDPDQGRRRRDDRRRRHPDRGVGRA